MQPAFACSGPGAAATTARNNWTALICFIGSLALPGGMVALRRKRNKKGSGPVAIGAVSLLFFLSSSGGDCGYSRAFEAETGITLMTLCFTCQCLRLLVFDKSGSQNRT